MATWIPQAKRWYAHVAKPQNSAQTTVGIASIEFRGAIGGPNLAVSSSQATAIAGLTGLANLFDGNANTAATGPFDTWICYEFATPTAIAEVAITARADSNVGMSPSQVAFYAEDLTGHRFQLAIAVGQSWTAGQTKAFPIGLNVGSTAQQRAESARWAGGGSGPPAPSATVLPLKYSTAPSKSNPALLAGANVSGPIYVYLDDTTSLTKVEFWIDNATPSAPTGAPDHTENLSPWDLYGTASTAPYDPIPLDTATLSNANHTITVRLTVGGVVQPVYSATFAVANTVTDPVTYKFGVNSGTNSGDPTYFDAWNAFVGRPARISTVNGALYTLNEMAYFNGAYGWRWFIKDTPTTGHYEDYWVRQAWMPSDMMLAIQFAPAGGQGAAMFTKETNSWHVSATAQANYDALMRSQITGANDTAWRAVGASHATRGRSAANLIMVLAHEFNHTGYPWGPANLSNDEWIAMWRRAVIQYRIGFASVLPNVQPPLSCWCYGANGDPAKSADYTVGPSVWACYPGDDVVDVIGVHHYDFAHWPLTSDWTVFRQWQNSIAKAVDYARAHNKLVYFGEGNIINAPTPDGNQRGPAPAQDNPVFFDLLYNWAQANRFQNDGVSPLMLGMSIFQNNDGSAAGTKYLVPANNGSVNLASRNTAARLRVQQLWGGA